MSFAASIQSLRQFSADLRRLPLVVAQKVAAQAAPALTRVAKATFDAGEDPYGVNWVPGADGQKVTLRKSGALERFIHYVAIGTKLRVALGVRYAKYQIGKRPVFPRQGAPLPADYVRTLQRTAVDVVRSEIGRAGG
jgi:hypothetical protein